MRVTKSNGIAAWSLMSTSQPNPAPIRRREAIGVALACLVLVGLMSWEFTTSNGMFGPKKISGDGWDSYAMTHSLFFDRDLELTNQFRHCCNQFRHKRHPVTGRYTRQTTTDSPI